MNETQELRLRTLLKNNGYSFTTQRRLVLEKMLTKDAVTIRELIDSLDGAIDRVSVYRVIELFEKIGVIQRINIGWKYKLELTDLFSNHHHHIACLNCGKVTSINENEFERFVDNIGASYDFEVKSHQIEIQGYCNKCLKGAIN